MKTLARSGLPAKTAQPGGEVRVIGGQWKRSKLPVLNWPGLRPTPSRVRETLFNWLGQDLRQWRCLDAFAGTGALGFEAASRGASYVLMCEQNAVLVAQLQKIQEKLGATQVQIVRGDGLATMERVPAQSLDLVMLDPPFDSLLFDRALHAAARIVRPMGFVYLEAPRRWEDADLAGAGLGPHRFLRSGAVHAHLLQVQPVQTA